MSKSHTVILRQEQERHASSNMAAQVRLNVYFEFHPERDFALDVYYHPYAHVSYGDDGLAA